MTIPDRSVIAATHGYHPLVADSVEVLSTRLFSDVLVLGPSVPDVGDLVQHLRHLSTPPVQLPEGIYWFSGETPAAVLIVDAGGPPGASQREQTNAVSEGSPLNEALNWLDHLWDQANEMPRPAFAV